MNRKDSLDAMFAGLSPEAMQMARYLLVGNMSPQTLILDINDEMLRSLPPDHPALTGIEPWELPGLTTFDEDPHQSSGSSTHGGGDDEVFGITDDISRDELLSLMVEIGSGRCPIMLRGAERQRIPQMARLASTRSFLSNSSHPGVNRFLESLERLVDDFGSIPEALRSIESDEPWKGIEIEDKYNRMRDLVQASFASFSATVIDLFGHEATSDDDTGGSGPEEPMCPVTSPALLQVVQGFVEDFRMVRDNLIWYIDVSKTIES